jgi:ATP-dependent Clp protease ATP-binding subunit ClpC
VEWSSLVAIREAFGPDLPGFTDRAIKVLAVARLEANARHHANMTAEHLLLALAQVELSVASYTLKRLGVDLLHECGELEAALAAIPRQGEGRDVARNMRTQLLLRRAKEEAQTLGHNYVGTEHLVLALLVSGPSAASGFLGCRGISKESFRKEVLRILAGP